jgi:hypothetical protein
MINYWEVSILADEEILVRDVAMFDEINALDANSALAMALEIIERRFYNNS